MNPLDALTRIVIDTVESLALRTDREGPGRRARLIRLGFERAEAERLASLHTRNFM